MARPRPWRATGVALLVLSLVLAAPVEATSLQVPRPACSWKRASAPASFG